MNRLFVIVILGLVVGCFVNCHQHTDTIPSSEVDFVPEEGKIDLARKPLERIPVGTVIGAGPPEGWSHLVLIAIPTPTPEDARLAPKLALHYAQLFKFTVLAQVTRSAMTWMSGPFQLAKVARGFATTIDGQEKIVSGPDTLGADLGMFGRTILDENEKIVDNDVRQVVRTPTMLIFDAKSVMLDAGTHVARIMRHALLVDPGSGRLDTLVWLLTDSYEAAEGTLQLLPESLHEPRYLSVKRDKFVLGLPTRDAFALRRIPQGTPVPYTAELKKVATVRHFSEAQVPQIEQVLRASARQVRP